MFSSKNTDADADVHMHAKEKAHPPLGVLHEQDTEIDLD